MLILQDREQYMLWRKLQQTNTIEFSEREAHLKRMVRVSHLEKVTLRQRSERAKKEVTDILGNNPPFRQARQGKGTEASNCY